MFMFMKNAGKDLSINGIFLPSLIYNVLCMTVQNDSWMEEFSWVLLRSNQLYYFIISLS